MHIDTKILIVMHFQFQLQADEETILLSNRGLRKRRLKTISKVQALVIFLFLLFQIRIAIV